MQWQEAMKVMVHKTPQKWLDFCMSTRGIKVENADFSKSKSRNTVSDVIILIPSI